MKTHCGTIALLGPPNAGKSTLLNALIGAKVSIVTPKAQTTRSRITGVLTEGEAQLIFLDVPGLFESQQKFERAMVKSAWGAAAAADVILFLFDARKKPNEETERVIKKLGGMEKKMFLALNKTDTVENKPTLLDRAQWFRDRANFSEIFFIAAREGEGLDALKAKLVESLPEGAWHHDADTLTDLPMRILASELTREQCFLALQEELPYTLNVETEMYETRPDGSVEIRQVVTVQSERVKTIVIGAKGQMLKKIGEKARKEIAKLAGVKCHLYLFVKVRADWKEKPDAYQYLGLDY